MSPTARVCAVSTRRRSISSIPTPCFNTSPAATWCSAYLREARRVMKTGGLARIAVQRPATSPALRSRYLGRRALLLQRTPGIRIGARFPGAGTGRRRHAIYVDHLAQTAARLGSGQETREVQTEVRIRRITNANSSEPVAPCRGRFASISIWVENLPPEAGLHHLQVTVGSSLGSVCDISPPDHAGLQQVNGPAAGTGGHRFAAGGNAMVAPANFSAGNAARDSPRPVGSANSIGLRRSEPGGRTGASKRVR